MKTNQKMTLRRLGALLLALAMTFALASCGSKTFDASGYVDASMKLVTTGDAKRWWTRRRLTTRTCRR